MGTGAWHVDKPLFCISTQQDPRVVPYTARGEIWVRPKEDIWIAKGFENGKIGPPEGYCLQGLRRPPFLHPKNKTIRGVLKVLKTINCLGGWTQDSMWRESGGGG